MNVHEILTKFDQIGSVTALPAEHVAELVKLIDQQRAALIHIADMVLEDRKIQSLMIDVRIAALNALAVPR